MAAREAVGDGDRHLTAGFLVAHANAGAEGQPGMGGGHRAPVENGAARRVTAQPPVAIVRRRAPLAPAAQVIGAAIGDRSEPDWPGDWNAAFRCDWAGLRPERRGEGRPQECRQDRPRNFGSCAASYPLSRKASCREVNERRASILPPLNQHRWKPAKSCGHDVTKTTSAVLDNSAESSSARGTRPAWGLEYLPMAGR